MDEQSILKFVLENSLAKKKHDRYLANFYLHDIFGFAPEIQTWDAIGFEKKDFYFLIRIQLMKPETLN